MWQKSYDGSPSVYLVPTPIGNLKDITLRSLEILESVDVIFSEDTRVTAQLLNHYNIKKKLVALHDHNEEKVKEKVLYYLKEGKNVALTTDRGTPIISDPGYKTVEYIKKNGFNVIGLPGACAFVPALIASGISAENFLFYGFLNSKETKRLKELEKLESFEKTIIFYEAPHRIKKTMDNILNVFGNRIVSISREISKKYESIYYGNIKDLLPDLEEIKGEFVIIVEGKKEEPKEINVIEEIDKLIETKMSVSDAIKKVAKDNNLSKNDVYNQYHSRR